MKTYYKLNLFAILLAAVVVILGAYTRLTDAGLGCPDWPGCYGFMSVPEQPEQVALAEQAFPERPVEAHKAWNEMIHRYFAGGLGLIIGIMFLLSMKLKVNRGFATVLLITVCFQALLGMWTVTMDLMPVVVMGHLLGGFTTFCLLVLSALMLNRKINAKQIQWAPSSKCHEYYKVGKIAFFVLALQIALGGWTAANYAAVACTELPICEGQWSQRLDFKQAFSVPEAVPTYEYGALPYEARMTIHVMHRFGAILTMGVILWLCVLLFKSRSSQIKRYALAIGSLVSIQFILGIINVALQLPLFIAVAHNFVALCLLATLLSLLFNVRNQDIQQTHFNTWLKE